jgi:hypothetical protein
MMNKRTKCSTLNFLKLHNRFEGLCDVNVSCTMCVSNVTCEGFMGESTLGSTKNGHYKVHFENFSYF